MASEKTVTVQVSRRFTASAERVFDAWLEPAHARQFLFATPTGEMIRCKIDARIGGSYSIVERRDGEDVEHVGEYTQIDRPRQLEFTLRVPKFSDATSVIRIDITELDDGCELTLTSEDVPTEWAESSREGWGGILETLAGIVVG